MRGHVPTDHFSCHLSLALPKKKSSLGLKAAALEYAARGFFINTHTPGAHAATTESFKAFRKLLP
jgi:hypothetical protein